MRGATTYFQPGPRSLLHHARSHSTRRQVSLRGATYAIPADAEWMLSAHYGDWRTVRRCAHAPDGPCPPGSEQ